MAGLELWFEEWTWLRGCVLGFVAVEGGNGGGVKEAVWKGRGKGFN